MKKKKFEAIDDHYVGNVFGWKTSLWAAALILSLLLLAAGRHYYLGVPLGYEDPDSKIKNDTIEVPLDQ